MSRFPIIVLLALLLAFTVAACGNKGPLVRASADDIEDDASAYDAESDAEAPEEGMDEEAPVEDADAPPPAADPNDG